MENQIVKLVRWGAIAVVALILVSCAITTVSTGHVGVQTQFGQIVGTLDPGIHLINPLNRVHEMDTRVLKWESDTWAYSRDVQQAHIFFALNYRLESAAAAKVFQNVGEDWSTKLVGQVIHAEIKREMGQYEAVSLIANREKATRTVYDDVAAQLSKNSVIVTGFQITNIDYTPEFEKAVEAKQIAQQDAIREQNHTVQVREQANQKIETARGDAESTLLNAKAEAESMSIRAKALEANPKLVEWQAVQKWDGSLPTYMMGGGAVPFINLTKGSN